MFTPFFTCALVTAISAIVSLGFSVAAVRSETQNAQTMALYACVRSAALGIASIVSFWTGSSQWLLAVAVIMIIVQAGDALIGLRIKDHLKTFGPAATSIINLLALSWLIQSVS